MRLFVGAAFDLSPACVQSCTCALDHNAFDRKNRSHVTAHGASVEAMEHSRATRGLRLTWPAINRRRCNRSWCARSHQVRSIALAGA
jgi:hypothetical protein